MSMFCLYIGSNTLSLFCKYDRPILALELALVNVKLKIIKIRARCHYNVQYIHNNENSNWTAQNLQTGHMRPAV